MVGVGPCLSLHYSSPPLHVMNGPLPAVLKFRKNTDQAPLGAARAQR